ncbi:hypothetical protein [Shewanella sp. UCD-KL12]|nr:hypothetical protein [Shewanella sp. UCD-KL12]
MKRNRLRFISSRRRTQQRSRHLRTMSRQKMFFVFIKPNEQ